MCRRRCSLGRRQLLSVMDANFCRFADVGLPLNQFTMSLIGAIVDSSRWDWVLAYVIGRKLGGQTGDTYEVQ